MAGAVPLDPVEDGAPSAGVTALPADGRPDGGRPAGPTRPRIAGPLEAFLRHPILTLLPLVLLVGGALYASTERDPEYTAKSRITVGTTNVNPFLLQEVVAGNQAIAASYARAIAAPEVAAAAARDVGISPAEAHDRLSATQVAGSTLIQVEATGSSSAFSIRLANAGAHALIDYVRQVNRTDEPRRLFKQYQKAQAETRRAEQRTQALLRSKRRLSQAATDARITQDLAALRALDLANRYRAASSEAAAASRLTLIAPAAGASSDRSDVLEQLLVVAAVGGLVLGFALSLLWTNWGVLRALRDG